MIIDYICNYLLIIIQNLHFFLFGNREQQKALKEASANAKGKGPMGGGGIKKSGKK